MWRWSDCTGVQKRVSAAPGGWSYSSCEPRNVGTEFVSSVRVVGTLNHWAVSPDLQMTVPCHICNSTSFSIILFRGCLRSLPLCQPRNCLGRNFLSSQGFTDREVSPVASPTSSSLSSHKPWIWLPCFSPFSRPPRRPHTHKEKKNTTH